MAQVTFTIPDTKIQFFVDCFGEDYATKVQQNTEQAPDVPFPEVDGVSKGDYAKTKAFEYLADRARNWHRTQQAQAIEEIDITQ